MPDGMERYCPGCNQEPELCRCGPRPRMGHVMTLDVGTTHKGNPNCPMRIVPHPDGRSWYCLDCGLPIIMKAVEVDLNGVDPARGGRPRTHVVLNLSDDVLRREIDRISVRCKHSGQALTACGFSNGIIRWSCSCGLIYEKHISELSFLPDEVVIDDFCEMSPKKQSIFGEIRKGDDE